MLFQTKTNIPTFFIHQPNQETEKVDEILWLTGYHVTDDIRRFGDMILRRFNRRIKPSNRPKSRNRLTDLEYRKSFLSVFGKM